MGKSEESQIKIQEFQGASRWKKKFADFDLEGKSGIEGWTRTAFQTREVKDRIAIASSASNRADELAGELRWLAVLCRNGTGPFAEF